MTAASLSPARRAHRYDWCAVSCALLLSVWCAPSAHCAEGPQQAEPQAEQPAIGADVTCEAGDQTLPWIDRVHRQMFEMTCATAYWFDGFFGTRHDSERYRRTHGSIAPGLRWDERDGFEPSLRFRAQLELPRLSERYNAFIGRLDRDEFVSNTESDFTALPSRFGADDDETLLGLGYSRSRKVGHDLDASAGVRLRFPLDPYVKGSYRYLTPIGRIHLLRASQTIFWQNSEGFGTTSRFDLDRALSETLLVRWGSSGTFSEESQGVRWRSGLTLFHSLDRTHALAYRVGIAGETDRDVDITDYGVEVIYRRRFVREWLFLELRSGVTWPRESLEERRQANLGLGIAFELHFGELNGAALPVADADAAHSG